MRTRNPCKTSYKAAGITFVVWDGCWWGGGGGGEMA